MATKRTKTDKDAEATPDEGRGLSGAKGAYSLTLYFFAVVNGRRFPAQQTLACDDAEEFTRMLPEFYAAFDPSGDEDEFVVYEPRDIGPATRGASGKSRSSGGGGGGGEAEQQRVLGPECPFHGTPTTQKEGPRGKFFSCSKKRDGGAWCNWTPDDQE